MSIGDGQTRFTPRVADYVAARPTYPIEIIDLLHQRLGFDADWNVVDVGAGTGISSALFLGNGNAVTAVEPNDAMRAAADKHFAEDPNYDSVGAPAEATTLPDGSADLIVAAQAFHWFDQAAFARECLRLLTPRGRVLLMWNQSRPDASPAAAAYQDVIHRHALDFTRIASKWKDSHVTARTWFTHETYMPLTLENPQSYNAERLLTRMASSSYMPTRDHPGYEPMRADLDAAFALHAKDGVFTLPYACEMFVGVPRSG